MINNFILTLLEWGGHGQNEADYLFRCILLKKTTEQIKYFYPNANIHVISDRPIESKDIIVHSFKTNQSNHCSKFEVFSLLNEPAMFMDSDILMTRPFSKRHLRADSEFNLFTSYKPNKKYPTCGQYPHYNTGIIWIPHPSESITRNILKFHKEYGIKENSDEYAISRYVDFKNLKINEHPDVNVYRANLDYQSFIREFQTIHYPRQKELFLKEYRKFHKKRILI